MLGKRLWGSDGGERSSWALPAVASAAGWLIQTAGALSAWLGVSFAVPMHQVSGLTNRQVRGLELVAVGCLLIGLLLGVSEVSVGTLRTRLQGGLASAWQAGLPLGLLPFVNGNLRIVPALVSVGFGVRFLPERALARLTERRAWQLALLGFAATIGVAFVAVGRALPGSTSNDAAYYFGVARYMTRTHQFREPIVWQFLNRAQEVVHRPFDYWHGAVPLSFVSIFSIFGCSYRVAGTAMGFVSGSSVVLLAYLLAVAAPLRNAALQVLAVLLFALSPALVVYRFDVETIPFVHVWLLTSLIFLARRQLVLATVTACTMFLFRADSASLAVLLCAWAGYLGFENDARPHALRDVALTLSAFALSYVSYHWLMFGTLGPPGALIAARLSDGIGPYCWFDQAPMYTWAQRMAPAFIAERVQVALNTLQQVIFFTNYPLWLGCSLLAGAATRHGIASLARLLLYGGAAGVALASPAVFAWWRSLHALLPVFVLAGAYGAETLLGGVGRFLGERFTQARWSASALGAATLVFVFTLLGPLQVAAAVPEVPEFARELAQLGPTFAGQTVMCGRSWYVLAYTNAPVVQLPFNGEDAIATVIGRYHVKWVVLVKGESVLGSNEVVNKFLSGKQQTIGGVRLTQVSESPLLIVLAVQ